MCKNGNIKLIVMIFDKLVNEWLNLSIPGGL
jgi:hypothetical protein